MQSFERSLERLKHELRVSKDSEVAAKLGMSKTAFSERKKRGSFPEREVLRLIADSPDLDLDVTYVLTGARASVHMREHFTALTKTVLDMEPDGGLLSGALSKVFKEQGTLRDRPEYVALLEVLDWCSPADLELMRAIAVRLAKK